MTKSFLPLQLTRIAVVFVLFWFTHNLLVNQSGLELYQNSGYWRIYAFLVPITFLGIVYIYSKFKKDNGSVIKSFMILSIVKMLGSLTFLLPWLLYKDEYSRPFVIQFFLIYFPILFFETAILVKMINQPISE